MIKNKNSRKALFQEESARMSFIGKIVALAIIESLGSIDFIAFCVEMATIKKFLRKTSQSPLPLPHWRRNAICFTNPLQLLAIQHNTMQFTTQDILFHLRGIKKFFMNLFLKTIIKLLYLNLMET